ncbi:MAG: hypothetical protein ACJA0C_001397 [Candidatus Endobugula sp.]|jgi:hypothetical protein
MPSLIGKELLRLFLFFSTLWKLSTINSLTNIPFDGLSLLKLVCCSQLDCSYSHEDTLTYQRTVWIPNLQEWRLAPHYLITAL